ncbi:MULTISPECIES: response regulator [Sphingomonas]|nr:response regulator [Sphingomonas sp. CGMCC 1.13658]
MGRRVLCVDDEPFIRMVLAECVAGLGLEPVEASNGEEALDAFSPTGIDLLITDIRLGGISGWQVAEMARALKPDLPIIYISGFPSGGEKLPDTIYLPKPFRPHQLEDAVRSCLDSLKDAA